MYSLLGGIRVLDFSQYVTEVVGCHFADMGAEVIKIEPPPRGSLSRLVDPYITHLARNKKSLAINLKNDDAKAVFARLVIESDVIIDGLRSGALDELGFGYEQASKLNPKLVFLSVSGWGQTGPYRRLASHGQAFDAFSSMEPVVFEDGKPRSVFNAAVELSGQMGCSFGVIAALSALIHAQKTGRGVHIDVSEGEAGAWYLWSQLYNLLNQPEDQRNYTPPSVRQGEEPRTRYRVYPTKDDSAVFFMALEQKFWVNFCTAIGRADLAARGNWVGGLDAGGYPGEYEELAEIFRSRTKQEWLELFIENDVAGGPTNSLVSLLKDPHFLSRDPIVEVVNHRGETRKMLGTPVKIKGEHFKPHDPPALGRDTDEILRMLGCTESEVTSLHEKGAVQ